MKNLILASLGGVAMVITSGAALAQNTDNDAANSGSNGYMEKVAGHDLLKTANIDAAVEELEARSRQSGNDPAVLINLGQAYARSGNYALAEQSLKKARDSRNRYDIMLANGAVMSTRDAAKQALTWLEGVKTDTVLARN